MPNKTSIECSFCHESHVDYIIEGPVINDQKIYICENCITESYKTIERSKKEQVSEKFVNNLTPSEIKEHLDNYIIGQDQAKRSICVAIYNHYKRINQTNPEVEIQKNNIMMIGPSGTGKTLIAKTVADIMNVPFTICDATSITETGYVGNDVEHVIENLIIAADGNIAKAEAGIIFIDEIDKKRKKSSYSNEHKDASGEGVQQALLKLVEGTRVRVRNPLSGNKVDIDTKNILFICGGAFVGLNDIVKQNRQGNQKIGFNAQVQKQEECDIMYLSAKSDDLIDYGLIPEFVGRFSTVVALDRLTESSMRSILTEPKNAITKQYQELFKIDGVNLILSEGYIDRVAKTGFEQKTGARSLRTIIENDLKDVQFDLPQLSKDGIKYVYVHDDGTIKPSKRKITKTS